MTVPVLPLRHLSLQSLTESDATIARVWRLARFAQGGVTSTELMDEVGIQGQSVNRIVHRLINEGWMRRREMGRYHLYFAIESGAPDEDIQPSQSARSTKLANMRERIKRMEKVAHDARYSAVTSTMGGALMELEKRLRELRSQLQPRDWR